MAIPPRLVRSLVNKKMGQASSRKRLLVVLQMSGTRQMQLGDVIRVLEQEQSLTNAQLKDLITRLRKLRAGLADDSKAAEEAFYD